MPSGLGPTRTRWMRFGGGTGLPGATAGQRGRCAAQRRHRIPAPGARGAGMAPARRAACVRTRAAAAVRRPLGAPPARAGLKAWAPRATRTCSVPACCLALIPLLGLRDAARPQVWARVQGQAATAAARRSLASRETSDHLLAFTRDLLVGSRQAGRFDRTASALASGCASGTGGC